MEGRGFGMAKNTGKEPPAVKGVSAAERALAVLTAFRRGDGALSLAELAERTGLVKSTIMRLAVSLQRYRLLARLPDGSYRLDAETLRLGTAYQQAFSLADHVMPALEQLAPKTGETASFYVRHRRRFGRRVDHLRPGQPTDCGAGRRGQGNADRGGAQADRGVRGHTTGRVQTPEEERRARCGISGTAFLFRLQRHSRPAYRP